MPSQREPDHHLATDAAAEPLVDGRQARRERGRLAVTKAMIDLVFEGHAPPTVDQITERAGVSAASLFRYFETLDDLREHATRYYFERFSHLFEVPDIGVGSLQKRITAFTAARVEQYERTGPMARLMRSRAPMVSELDATLQRLRATHADQIRMHFEDELEGLSPAARDDRVAVLATMTSFESWDQFRHHHRRSPSQTRRAWTLALDRILGGP